MDKQTSQKDITYYNEISLMMFGFGDSHKPNPSTVKLVESIVLEQLRTIVQEALKYSDSNQLTGNHLVFLMRHNKHKMRRFVKYLHNKHLKNTVCKQSNIIDVDQTEKPKSELLTFIEFIDETGEFTDLTELDEVKYERQLRADRISQALDEKKYLEFCKARATSFKSREIWKSSQKLRSWIDPDNEFIFEPDALEVLGYYAYQTVAELIDYALLVRSDSKYSSDPIKHLSGSYYTSTMFNGDFRIAGASGTNPDYSKVHSGQPAITVNEIREVMRRVYMPQAGKLNFGGKLPQTHYIFAI